MHESKALIHVYRMLLPVVAEESTLCALLLLLTKEYNNNIYLIIKYRVMNYQAETQDFIHTENHGVLGSFLYPTNTNQLIV